MSGTLTMVIESVVTPHAEGWSVEARCDGVAIATYGPFADRVFAQLMAQEIGRRTVELAERYKVSKIVTVVEQITAATEVK